jgi:superfamily II DNA or RNA helicase
MLLPYAPGSRVEIRNEEWLVKRVDPAADGGYLLDCDGISDLVQGRSALFLTKLEDKINVLDPAETKLAADTSPTYNAALLFLESMLRRNLPNDVKIHLGHRGVMTLVPYQLDPAIQGLKQPRTRLLIADAVGLGKTLEAGILATELIQRGRGKRILVVTQKAMLTQFQKEWWSRFSIPLVRLDSQGLARVRNRIPANHNPFNYFDRSIISVDTLKSNLEYRNYLENAWWDIIVIDECHNVAARAGETGLSRRARLARLLANRSDTLLLLSATPHDGSARSFASLMSLLDPTAISEPDDYTRDDYRNKGLVIRRFKKDIKDQVSDEFQERVVTRLRQPASPLEEEAYRALLAIRFTQSGQHRAGRQQELQRIGAQKGMFSSSAAALESTRRRIALLKGKDDITSDERIEVEGLETFKGVLEMLVAERDSASFSKYQKLLSHLRSEGFAWTSQNPLDRLVIFSERIETLRWLQEHLKQDLKLNSDQVVVLDGSMGDTEQQAIVERFGRSEDPVRVLLCSDVASEGLNLHYFCHRLVHFDLPWSLMVFQQRNGRVDRYGQKRQPQIVYLFTEAATEKIRGDFRILEILEKKDEQAAKNLGDPSVFLNVYDPDKESEKVIDMMASGTTAEQVEATLDATAQSKEDNEGDYLLRLFGGGTAEPKSDDHKPAADSLDDIEKTVSLFDNDFDYARAAIQQLNQGQTAFQWSDVEADKIIAITAPKDLQERLKQLPREVQSADDRYLLCADPARVAQAIEAARQAKAEEESWPDLHYLWPLHPIMEWLGDRVLTHFGRHRSPLIQSPRLASDEQAFVLMSMIPNRKGQPLLVEWQAATRRVDARGRSAFKLEPFKDFAGRVGLAAGRLPNPGPSGGTESVIVSMQQALPSAIRLMEQHMTSAHRDFTSDLKARLVQTLADLAALQQRQIRQLELDLENQIETVRQSRFSKRSNQIKGVFDDYRKWVEDTLTAEPKPWIQVMIAVCHPDLVIAAGRTGA